MLAKKGEVFITSLKILWYFTEETAKKVTVRFFAFFVDIDVSTHTIVKL